MAALHSDKQEAIVCETTRGGRATVSRLGRIDTIRFSRRRHCAFSTGGAENMSRKLIEALASGHYWAVPHAPFPLDAGNGHDEVYPGAHCVSDGKWVTFYRTARKSGHATPCMAPPISIFCRPHGCESTAD